MIPVILPLLHCPRDGRALSVFPNYNSGTAVFKHRGKRNREESGTNTALHIHFLFLMLLLCKHKPRAEFVRLGADGVALSEFFCSLTSSPYT